MTNTISLLCLLKVTTCEFRAYDEGVAYRWGVEKKGPFKVMSEKATFAFPADHIRLVSGRRKYFYPPGTFV